MSDSWGLKLAGFSRKGRTQPRRAHWIALLLIGCSAFGQTPDPWPDPGPPSTRDLFPLNLIPLTYRPIGADTLGKGNWRVSLQVTRSNTFEFSDLVKDLLQHDTQGRIVVDHAGVTAFAQAHREEPLIYYFDAEIQRTEFHVRYGVTPSTDLAVTFAWQGIDGGFLDGLIEEFHKLGFNQTGRSGIAKDQLALFVIQKGEVVVFSQEPVRVHPEDPVLTLIQRIHEDPNLTVSLVGAIQPPLTRWQGVYQSNWDSSAGLVFRWRPTLRLVIDGGAAYLRRGLKGSVPNAFFIKDQLAAHLGGEWRAWGKVRPYLVLIGTNRITSPQPGSKLDRPSMLIDLGANFRLNSRTALTLSYINNISHNENTADMGIALRLAVRP